MAKARKSTAKAAAPKSSAAPKSTAQKPMATGDVGGSPNVFRADMGEALPPQKDSLNPDRAK